jgi:Zn-dependent protease
VAAPVRLRSDLRVVDPGSGADHVVICDELRSRYFRIAKLEYARLREGVPADGDDAATAALVARAHDLYLLEGAIIPSAETRHRRSLGFFPLFDIDPRRVLDRLRAPIRVVTGPGVVALGVGLLVAGVAALVGLRQPVRLTPTLWSSVAFTMPFALVAHEFAHAAMVTRFGGQVRRVGVALVYLRPVAFCDVSAAWEFPKRGQRVLVAFAGIYTTLFIAAASWSLLWVPRLPIGFGAFLRVYGIANVAVAILNLFPFIKLDGYWMLASALDRPNLRRSATSAVRAFVTRRPDERVGVLMVLFGVGCVVAPPLLVVSALQAAWLRAESLFF